MTNELPKIPSLPINMSETFNWKEWFSRVKPALNNDPKPDYLTPRDYWALDDDDIGYLNDVLEDDNLTETNIEYEAYRTYIYPSEFGGNFEYTINKPVYLIEDTNKPGVHIIETDTEVFEVAPGWIVIKRGY